MRCLDGVLREGDFASRSRWEGGGPDVCNLGANEAFITDRLLSPNTPYVLIGGAHRNPEAWQI